MANGQPQFTVINGGTGSRTEATLVDTGVVDEHGNRIVRRKSHSGDGEGGDGSMKFTLPDLRWNVAILNGLASLFFVGLIGMWLWMVDRIDDKFEDADTKVTEISKSVADLRVEIEGQRGDIKVVLQRLDDKTPAPKGPEKQ